MTSDSTTQQSGEWWRWALMPFAAILGGFLGAMLFALLNWFGMKMMGGFSEDGWMFRYFMPVFSSGAFGWLYTLISCHVAPRGKVLAGTVMVTILFILSLISLALVWLMQKHSIGDSILLTVGNLVCLVAAVVTLQYEHTEEKAGRAA